MPVIRLILSLKPSSGCIVGVSWSSGCDAEVRILFAERLHHVAEVALRDDVLGFAGKEAASDDADRHIEVSHALARRPFAGGAAACERSPSREAPRRRRRGRGGSVRRGGRSHAFALSVSEASWLDFGIGFGLKRFAQDDLLEQGLDLVVVRGGGCGDLVERELIGGAEFAGEGEGEQMAGESPGEAVFLGEDGVLEFDDVS